MISRSLHVIIQANRLADGQRKITSITEVLDIADGQVEINEVFTFQRHGMNEDHRILGQHVYLSESKLLERFYQSGALPRP
jgi:pilus assembly protein CpaF